MGETRFARRWAAAISAAAFAANVLATVGASAQTLPEPIDFAESFVGGAPVAAAPAPSFGGAVAAAPAPAPQTAIFASQLIVGVAFGASRAPVDLAALRILAPVGGDDEAVCVALTTVDGRYAAQSAHPVDAGLAGPAALGLTTAYADELAGYALGDLLVRAVRAADCLGEPEGSVAPALLDDSARVLTVSVNLGRGRPRAWLERDGARVVDPERCAPSPSAARTHLCRLNVDALDAGAYDLVVFSRRPGGDPIERRVAVALP